MADIGPDVGAEAGGRAQGPVPDSKRWVQLALGIVCMIMIANLQYGWTLFVGPMDAKYGWGRAAIQVAFSLFVLTETWLVPIEGWFVDRFGPKLIVLIGGVLVALSWSFNAVAASLPVLYVAAIMGGIGAGAVYGTCVGNALKWFPDKRGLASGLTAAGFGMGSALTIIPIQSMIATSGYQTTFLAFGLGQGAVTVFLAVFLAAPKAGDAPRPSLAARAAAALRQSARDATPWEMLRSPVFYTMYAMFVLVGAGGLMATAQLAPIAEDFAVAKTPVSLVGLTLPALTFALSLDRVLNGLTRPFFGWVSDRIGRENTMFVAFALEAFGIWALSAFGHDPVSFVVLSGLVFFAWGEIYSLFPSTCTDSFGTRYATANAGLLYTAKGMAALLVPYGNVLAEATGSWHAIFVAAAAMNAVAALAALLVLKPLRARQHAAGVETVGSPESGQRNPGRV